MVSNHASAVAFTQLRLVFSNNLSAARFAKLFLGAESVELGNQKPAIPLAVFIGQLALSGGRHEPQLRFGGESGLGSTLYRGFSKGAWPQWATVLKQLKKQRQSPWRRDHDMLKLNRSVALDVVGVCRASDETLGWCDKTRIEDAELWLVLTHLVNRGGWTLEDLDPTLQQRYGPAGRALMGAAVSSIEPADVVAPGRLASAAPLHGESCPDPSTDSPTTWWPPPLVGKTKLASQETRGATSDRDFLEFFGDLGNSASAYLVYPEFILSDPAEQLLESLPRSQIYRKHARHYSGTRFIEVPRIVASNDLQAIVIVAGALGQFVRGPLQLVTDSQVVVSSERSLLSFGLTSNAVTELYINTHRDRSLFRLEGVASNPEILVKDGGEERRFGRNDVLQHGIVLRYRPAPKKHPTRFWFICAGLAAAGTPAAAWLLTSRWQEYHRIFETNDFLIVFEVGNDVNAFRSATEVLRVSRISQ